MISRRLYLVVALFVAALSISVVSSITLSQDKERIFTEFSRELQNKDVALYKDHGIFRQIGFSLASLTAPDVAKKAVIVWKYSLKNFPKAKAEELMKQLESNEVGIAAELVDGSYAVMAPEAARKLGIISYDDINELIDEMKDKIGINIVTGMSGYLGLKNTGKISHWDDATLDAVDFADQYLDKLVGTSNSNGAQ